MFVLQPRRVIVAPMRNLYSVTKGQQAIRDVFTVKHGRAGNMARLPAIFPDQLAPIVCEVAPRAATICHATKRDERLARV